MTLGSSSLALLRRAVGGTLRAASGMWIRSALACLLMPLGPLMADGIIYIHEVQWIPPPPPHVRPLPPPARRHFPMEVTRHRVTVEVDENLARTKVDETFFNPNDVQLEGVYLFPLPPEAAVSSFAMKVGGREVTGEILERDKARQIYEQIVRQVRDPGLLEYVDRGVFRASVFPIPARGNVDVLLEYSETLPRERGFTTYRYPLDTGKYSAGDYKDVVVDVRLRSSLPIRTLHCPSHEGVLVSRSGEREARVSFEAKVLRADKDFLLTWNVSEDSLAPVLMTHRGAEPEGFFFLSVAPRPEKAKTVPPKDVVFVIDTSGSMLGPKLEQVKKALRYCLAGLNPGDRFNVIDFATEARRFRDALVEVSDESRRAATAYVDGFKAGGGTNIEEALRLGLSDLSSRERLALMVLLTDGQPTIGVIAPSEILRALKEKNPDKRRVFVFGVGEDLNAKLLDALASESRGAIQYIRSQENIEVPLSNFFDKIDSPVFTDLEIVFPAGGVADLYPKPLPDLFRGEQLDIFGVYQADGPKTVVIKGKFQGEQRAFEYSLPFAAGSNPFIPRLWALRKIGYLLEQMRLVGETREVKDEVIRLSKRYGIITPYTSYLILEEDRIARREPLPPMAPLARLAERAASDALSGAPGGAAAPRMEAEGRRASESFGMDRGEKAVEMSRQIGDYKAGGGDKDVNLFLDAAVNADGVRVKQAEGRTFYLQGARWVDSALTAEKKLDESKTRHVKYLSDEYFTLLREEPGIGKLLSVGSEVVFLWKGSIISIDA